MKDTLAAVLWGAAFFCLRMATTFDSTVFWILAGILSWIALVILTVELRD